MAGFIKLSRDILDWGWYSDPNTRCVFLHLLLTANYEDKDYLGYKITRGQAVIGLNALADILGLTVRNVRTALNHLKSTSEVTIKTTNKFSIVTICEFERWQGCNFDNDKQSDKQSDKQLTSDRQTTDKPLTTPKEIKKERKEERRNNEEESINTLLVEAELRREREDLQKTIEEQKKELEELRAEIQKLKVSEDESDEKCNYKAIVDCWNENNSKKLGMVTKLTEKRKKAIKKALKDQGIDQQTLMNFFKILPLGDSWLYNPSGEHKDWKPDFDWWVANTRGWLTKALEGKVHKQNPQAFMSMMGSDEQKMGYFPHGRTIFHSESDGMYYTVDNFYYGDVDDGYTSEDRPDGAMLMLNNGRGNRRWNAQNKIWEAV